MSASNHLYGVEQHLVETLDHKHNKNILQLFERVLTLASYPELCDVFLIISICHENNMTYQFMESEQCIGYLHTKGSTDMPEPCVCYRVFTPEDVIQYKKHKNQTCKQ